MSGGWQPSEGGVAEICGLLREYLNPTTDQRRIFQELERCSKTPDFTNYLTYILCNAQGQAAEVRSSAGLLLKNQLRQVYSALDPAVLKYVQAEVLRSIGLEDPALRATVGTVISTIVEKAGLAAWPELLAGVVQCLDSGDYNHTEGALDALYKMCEDNPEQLDSQIPGLPERPINAFMPRLLLLLQSPHAKFRKLALGSANQFLIVMPQSLVANMDKYLQGVFALASDSSPEVRKLACSALVQLTNCRSDYLMPHMQGVVEYMLQASSDPDPLVALEATEFWTAFCESQQPPEILRDSLPVLIPTLLSNMVYEDDDEALQDAEDDSDAPDTDQDLKPRFHQPKSMGGGGVDEHGNPISEEEEEDDEDATVWNLRKCSASGLDTLSHTFGVELLPILMPIIQASLSQKDPEQWKQREAGVLALGAVSDGCLDGLLPLLPQIVPHLLPLLDDPKPLIRSITCWTLSRYSKWIVAGAEQPEGMIQFDAVLQAFLQRILDNNKKVQEAACSAFATLEEEAVDLLPGRLEPILRHLMFAFGKYQRRNMRILYDALGTLAECVGPELQDPKYLEVLMPPLTAKWGQLSDVDKDLLPLLECLTSLSQALGPTFAPYAEPIHKRCCHIIQLQLVAQGDPGRAGIHFEREFIVCALDLLSAVTVALGPAGQPLVQSGNLVDLVCQCCSLDAPDVRQGAFALLGDLAKTCPELLQPRLSHILTLCAAQLHGPEAFAQDRISAANNACWAVGEIAVKMKSLMAPVVIPIMSAIVPLMSGEKQVGHKRALMENGAITLGRLALACPAEIAPHLPHFLLPWAQCLRMVRDDFEKEDAFLGLCAVLRLNPMAATNSLPAVVQAIGSWRIIHNEDLKKELQQILAGYKQMLSESGSWDAFLQSLDPSLATKVVSEYGLQ